MIRKTTGAMQGFRRKANLEPSSAGLVLLYSKNHASLPAAWSLKRSPLVMGRDAVCDISLPVTAVSRRHAEIRRYDNYWHLHDLDSKNGVLLDGHRVSVAPLEPLHEIRVGDAILKFVDQDAEHFENYRLDGTSVVTDPGEAPPKTSLVGGFQIQSVVLNLARVASSALSVMILGETGTGKEIVAQELHRLSERPGRFCAINCAAVPPNLLESELFGFKRGAFSGADRDKPGLIQMADRGTLLLDEIGDMPLDAQAKLLRVLQSKEVLPLGATTPESVDVRIACATHQDLTELQRKDEFRADLFARLNEYIVRLPALRERKEDILPLTNAFLTRYCDGPIQVSFPFILGLLHYDWPYNVRELESCVRRALALRESSILGEKELTESIREAMLDYGIVGDHTLQPGGAHYPSKDPHSGEPEPAGAQNATPTEADLRALLGKHRGNVAAVGREFVKARMQVHRWMKRYGIRPDEYR